MAKSKSKATESSLNFDALLKLTPSLIAAYPALKGMLGEQGTQGDINQLIGALPDMIEKLKETDDESLQSLLNHITDVVPGLEEMLPQKKRV